MIPDQPPQVQRAVLLLWAAWFLGIGSAFISMSGEAWEFWAVMAVVFAFNAFLIYRTSRKGRWARVFLLLLTAATLALTIYPLDEPVDYSWWEWVEVVGVLALEVVAMYWLFTGEGARWFARGSTAP